VTTMSQARQAILNRFIASYVPLAFADVPVGEERNKRFSFDNEGAEPPAGDEAESWCRFSVQETESKQETIGGPGLRRWKREGVARLELYCVPNAGALKRDDMVGKFRQTFEGVNFSGVVVTECQAVDIGIEGAWWRVSALASFWFEELK
jgi:hypothetical protein